jgi:hypothetical protein
VQRSPDVILKDLTPLFIERPDPIVSLAFMEAASTADWPEDEDQIVFRE